MKKSLIFIKIFVSVFLLLISTNLYAKKAAIIVDYDTQEVLFEVNADTLNYPASLTKIMTLYIVFDYLDKNKLNWETQLNVSATAASRSPSKLYLKEGSTISVKNAVMASDAFFPFRDGLDEAAKSGVTAVVQPGGSVRDQEVIDAANEINIAMIFTGVRDLEQLLETPSSQKH